MEQGILLYQKTNKPQPTDQPSPTSTQPTSVADAKSSLKPSDSKATLVYGAWEQGQSVIKVVNSDGSNHVVIAKLPTNIKDVNVVSPSELLYIAETDNRDHGKKVNIYNLQTQNTRTLFEASSGFAIDDIVLSPDKKWLAA